MMKVYPKSAGYFFFQYRKLGAAALIGGVLLCGSGGCSSRNGRALTIHYFPFDAETLTAVTSENIVKRSRPCVLTSSRDVDQVTQLLDSALPTATSFGEMFIRLRVDSEARRTDQSLAVVDKEGGVRRAGVGVRRLAPDRVRALISFIEDRCP
jgi:hypothetical protein